MPPEPFSGQKWVYYPLVFLAMPNASQPLQKKKNLQTCRRHGHARRLLKCRSSSSSSSSRFTVDDLPPRDVIIVGGGAHGAATAHELSSQQRGASRKVSLAVVESSLTPAHSRSSSGGESRIFRLTDTKSHYASMAFEALPLWRELERQSGAELLRTTGCLDIVDEQSLEDALRTSESAGATVETLTGDEIAKRTQGAINLKSLETRYGGIYERSGGINNPKTVMNSYYRLLREKYKQRVEVLSGHSLIELEDYGSSFSLLLKRHNPGMLEAPFARISCEQLVFTAAAANPLLMSRFFGWRSLRESCVIQKMSYGFWRVQDLSRKAMEQIPVWRLLPSQEDQSRSIKDGGVVRCYGFPIHEHDGFSKVAPHDLHTSIPYPAEDSDLLFLAQGERKPDDDILRDVHESVVSRMLGGKLEFAADGAHSCLYTVTDDREFVLDYVPGVERGRAVVSICCQGSGFKHTPLIGSAIRDMVMMHGGDLVGAGGVVNLNLFRADRESLGGGDKVAAKL